jgi:uncharacterized protein (DUF2236 family)
MASLFPTDAESERLIVGPDSIAWRIGSDLRLYNVMLYPLLLQVSHPTVGAGVRDYSDFERRPWDRLLRTIDYVSLLVYGDAEAIPAGRRLRAMHGRFRGIKDDGEPYHALEPEAYAWVHATLLEAYVAGHAHFGLRLSAPEVEQFYREYRGLGRLIGVGEDDLPPDWRGFRAYFERVTRTELVRTPAIDRVLAAVRAAVPPPIRFPEPLWRAIRIPPRRALWLGGLGLLGPELRERLWIPWSRRDELEFRTLGAVSRAATPVMPRALRVTGPAQLRWRREAIARGPLGAGATDGPAGDGQAPTVPAWSSATPIPDATAPAARPSTRRTSATASPASRSEYRAPRSSRAGSS